MQGSIEMIINVGGRTDIVNYYTPWLVNRLKEGYVLTRNPYNRKQISRYDLTRKHVDAIIFCSKNYQPILEHMPEIEKKYPLYCHYTITCYDEDVEKKVPSIDESIQTLIQLSEIVGKERVSWRYDPILLTEKYTIEKHVETFEYITSKVHNHISSCIFSFVDMYKKVYRNMPEIIELTSTDEENLLTHLSHIADKYSITLQSCAVKDKYEKYGIKKSGCITSKILEESNNLSFKDIKHKGSRSGCCCMPWRDIGEYDTCLNACKYCYANTNIRLVKRNHKLHNPDSPLLIGDVNEDDVVKEVNQPSYIDYQQKLF